MVQGLVHLLDMNLVFGMNLSDDLLVKFDVVTEPGAIAENVAGKYPEADFGYDN